MQARPASEEGIYPPRGRRVRRGSPRLWPGCSRGQTHVILNTAPIEIRQVRHSLPAPGLRRAGQNWAASLRRAEAPGARRGAKPDSHSGCGMNATARRRVIASMPARSEQLRAARRIPAHERAGHAGRHARPYRSAGCRRSRLLRPHVAGVFEPLVKAKAARRYGRCGRSRTASDKRATRRVLGCAQRSTMACARSRGERPAGPHAPFGGQNLYRMLIVVHVRDHGYDGADLAACGGRAREDGEIGVAREISRTAMPSSLAASTWVLLTFRRRPPPAPCSWKSAQAPTLGVIVISCGRSSMRPR